MKLDTLGLQAFVAIAEHGSFLKAANALFITQAGLSRRLKNLELQLGVTLIERTTRSWKLSPVGVGFLPRAQRLMTELNNAFHEIRDASTLDQSEVCIACVSSVTRDLLPQVVLEYTKQFPRNRIRIFDAPASDVVEAIVSKRADVGITIRTGTESGVTLTPLLQDPFVLMCRDDHRLRNRSEIRWSELKSEPLILLNHSTGSGLTFERSISELKLVLPRLYHVQHPYAALGLVNVGLGAAILPRLTLQRDAYPRVRAIPLVEPMVGREISLVRRESTAPSPASDALAGIVRQVFADWERKPSPTRAGSPRRKRPVRQNPPAPR